MEHECKRRFGIQQSGDEEDDDIGRKIVDLIRVMGMGY